MAVADPTAASQPLRAGLPRPPLLLQVARVWRGAEPDRGGGDRLPAMRAVQLRRPPASRRPSHWACRFAHSRRWRPVGRRRKARASLTAPLCVQTTCQSGLDRMCSADGCLARGERATCTTAGAHRRASRLPSSGCTARRAIGAPFAALHATSVSDSQPAPPLALVAGRRPSLSRCGSSPPPATPTSAHSLTTAASMASTT